jgi:hypothetical protein
VTVCVKTCSGAAIGGAAVAITTGAGVVSGTTDAISGCVTLTLDSAGTYPTTISKSGYQDFDGDVVYACPGSTTIKLLAPGDLPCVIFVTGCGGVPLDGATVTINGNTYTATSYSSYDDGQARFTLPGPGSYPYTVSMPRYDTFSGTLVVSDSCSCGVMHVSLAVSSGYVCCDLYACCPVPTTLHLTDALYGSTTLTYDPVLDQWIGTIDASFPGGCGCPAVPVTITYTYACSASHGFGLQVSTNSHAGSGQCPGNDPGDQVEATDDELSSCCPLAASITAQGCNCDVPHATCTGNIHRLYPTDTVITLSE